MAATRADIEKAAALLRRGEVVAFPTETVYGLGANATNVDAVARVFEVKGRPRFDPLIVHVRDEAAARELVSEWPAAAAKLAAAFWPGPLTLVLPKRDRVPDLVTSGLPRVAVRVPDHPVALDLLREAGVPVAAPSANRFGRTSPTTAEHVREEFTADEVPTVLDGGHCRTGVESTVVAIDGDRLTVLRLGGTTVEALRAVVGEGGNVGVVTRAEAGSAAASPGMLDRHYAPRTPLTLTSDPAVLRGDGSWSAAYLWFQAPSPSAPAALAEAPAVILSPTGDLREAAANLFAAMRTLDALGMERIIAERVPDVGLGRAINDRLERAAR